MIAHGHSLHVFNGWIHSSGAPGVRRLEFGIHACLRTRHSAEVREVAVRSWAPVPTILLLSGCGGWCGPEEVYVTSKRDLERSEHVDVSAACFLWVSLY